MDANFEKNKKTLLEKINALRHPKEPLRQAGPTIIIFGAQSAFMDGLLDTMHKKCAFACFHDPEKAIDFCLNNPINDIVLDMDPPTDWKLSTDVFSSVSMMKPAMHFILLSKSPQSTPVETLMAQNADVLVKPFGTDLLFKKLTKINEM
jgi:DNA-binding response OmpR family regulator